LSLSGVKIKIKLSFIKIPVGESLGKHPIWKTKVMKEQ
jgi:hypothetical protein